MNTKQMIALWYTGLAAVSALLAYADSSTAYSSQATFPLLPVLASIAIVGGLLIATLRTSDEIDQKRVLLYSLGPPATVVAIYLSIIGVVFYLSDSSSETTPTTDTGTEEELPSLSEVNVLNPCLDFEDSPLQDGKLALLTGRIRNQSSEPVRSISIRVRLHNAKGINPIYSPDCDGTPPSPPDSAGNPIDGHIFRLDVDVPPKATRSFVSETKLTAPRMRPSNSWEWSYQVESVSDNNLYDY